MNTPRAVRVPVYQTIDSNKKNISLSIVLTSMLRYLFTSDAIDYSLVATASETRIQSFFL